MTASARCPTCALDVPRAATFCPRCRAVAEGRPYDPREVDRHERSYVLSLVLLSLGALAIPRLLRSPSFSPWEKGALALLGAAQTALALAIAVWFFGAWLPETLSALVPR